MHAKKSSNANMRFLFGSVFFFAVILLTIVLFIYFAMQEAWKKSPDTSYTYTITFAHELEGKNYSVYLDDSLLYTGNPIAADTVIKATRYTTEEKVNIAGTDTVIKIPHFTAISSLFVVDLNTNIPKIISVGNNSHIHIGLKEGKIIVDKK